MNKQAAYPLLVLSLCIMAVSCFSEVTLLPGLGFGAILFIAGISLLFNSDQTSGRSEASHGSHGGLVDVVDRFAGHRVYTEDDVLITSIVYGDFDILVTHSPGDGYFAVIDGLPDRDHETLSGYRTVEDALHAAKQHIDDCLRE